MGNSSGEGLFTYYLYTRGHPASTMALIANNLVINSTDYRITGSPSNYRERYTRNGWKQKPWTPQPTALYVNMRSYIVGPRSYNYSIGAEVPGGCPRSDSSSFLYKSENTTVDNGVARAVNGAYADFMEVMAGERASLGEALAETRKSTQMITDRLAQLYRAAKAFRKGNVFQGCVEFGLVKPKTRKLTTLGTRLQPSQRKKVISAPLRDRPSQASKNWLEYWFGWSPLVNDIQNAMDQLDSTWPATPIRGYGKFTVPGARLSSGGTIRTWNPVKCRAWCGASIRVTNPDLFLQRNLGLTSVVGVVWALIPFSFLVDWAFGVQNWLEAKSDFAGVDVINPWYSTHHSILCDWYRYQNTGSGPVESTGVIENMEFRRFTTFPKVTLIKPSAVRYFSTLERCISSAALLVSQLSGMKR